MLNPSWSIKRGSGPLVAMAIHDGHEMRDELREHCVLEEEARLREEDPYTGAWTAVAPTRLSVSRSRFEVDLNRPRETAVYRLPEDAWGLRVWSDELPEQLVRKSLEQYDSFYDGLGLLCEELSKKYGSFVVFDLHSYNHRRNGPDSAPASLDGNPDVNVGTGTMNNRSKWAGTIEAFIDTMSTYDFPDAHLDVRENVKFKGGNCARWIHENYTDTACVLSIEVKKFFMDEWTGKLDTYYHGSILNALRASTGPVLRELGNIE